MTVAETIIKKVLALPADKQLKLLDIVVGMENGKSASPRCDPEGILADTPTGLSVEDFQQNRREIWGFYRA